MDDRARLVFGQQALDRAPVADVGVDKVETGLAHHFAQAAQVAGIGQLVQHHRAPGARCKPLLDEVGADETGCAGNENHLTDAPAALRRKSASTISAQIRSSVFDGSQPSAVRARDASPTSCSASTGRYSVGSTRITVRPLLRSTADSSGPTPRNSISMSAARNAIEAKSRIDRVRPVAST